MDARKSSRMPSDRDSRRRERPKSKPGSEKSHSSSSHGKIRRRPSHTASWEILEEPDRASQMVQEIIQRKQKLRAAAAAEMSDKAKKVKLKKTKKSSGETSTSKLPPMTSKTRRELRKQKKQKAGDDEAQVVKVLYKGKRATPSKEGSTSLPSKKKKIKNSRKSSLSNAGTSAVIDPMHLRPQHSSKENRSPSFPNFTEITNKSSIQIESRRRNTATSSSAANNLPSSPSKAERISSSSKAVRRNGQTKRKQSSSSHSNHSLDDPFSIDVSNISSNDSQAWDIEDPPRKQSKPKKKSSSKVKSSKSKTKESSSKTKSAASKRKKSKSDSPSDPLLYPTLDSSATSTTVDMDISHSWDMDNVLEIQEYPPPKKTSKTKKKSSSKSKSKSKTSASSSRKTKSKKDSSTKSIRNDLLLFASSSNHSSASLKKLIERHEEIQEEDARMERAMDQIFFRHKGHSRGDAVRQKKKTKDKKSQTEKSRSKKDSSCLLSSLRRTSRKSRRRSGSPGQQDEQEILDEYLQKNPTTKNRQHHSEREWLARDATQAADRGHSLDFRVLPPNSPGSVHPQRIQSPGMKVVLP